MKFWKKIKALFKTKTTSVKEILFFGNQPPGDTGEWPRILTPEEKSEWGKETKEGFTVYGK